LTTAGSGIFHNLKQYNLPYPEAIFDIEYFRHTPQPFNTWAKEFFPGVNYQPNLVHYFVKLLDDKGKLTRLYTQVGRQSKVYISLLLQFIQKLNSV
jgi:NAD-dependent deacetylase sirtuin 3